MIRKIRFIALAALSALSFSLFLETASAQSDSVVFHVSAVGDDASDGSREHPWRTPEAAAAKVQDYMSAHPGQAVRLEFASGRYQLEGPLVFEGLRAPLTLAPEDGGEEVVLSGEKTISGWGKASGLPDALDGPREYTVLKADLRACGISDFGDVCSMDGRFDLYCDGRRQTLARWPDKGFINAGRALGRTDLEDTWIHVHGTVEGVLEYPDARMTRWMDEKDPMLFGYWYWDWSDKFQRLAAVDAVAGTFTLGEPWAHYGYRDSCRFYGLNLLCELDSPGEYYVDREAGVIYWIAPDDAARETVTPVFGAESMIMARDCKGLNVASLAFEGGRGGAVSIRGGEDCSISDCLFTRFGEDVIRIDGGFRHSVTGCFLHELGCGGIILTGGDRVKLEPCEFLVKDNIVEDFSLFKRTYEPAVAFYGVGLTVSHNRFRGSSSSALRLEGNDILVEYNQCFDLVRESDDQGGFDVFYDYSFRNIVLRFNHWKNISGGMFAGAAGVRFDDIISGQTVYSNVFENCGGGPENGGFGGVQINGGRDNLIYNNIFYNCRYAVSGKAFCGEKWRKALENELGMAHVEAVNALGPVYEARYPELKAHLFEEEGRNYVWSNLLINGERLLRDSETFVTGGNALIESHLSVDGFLSASLQRNYGLEPIPFKNIGPENNRWK